MIITSLLIGVLLIASILTFISLGFASPVPWLFLLAIAGIIVIARMREKSQYVTWKDVYSVGIEAIDADHQKLLHLVNQFQTAVYYRTGEEFEKEALDELVSYTKTHFSREEKLLAEHGYPELEAHIAEHQQMFKQVDDLMKAYGENRHKTMQKGTDFLRNWLINHINGTDQEYSQFLLDKGVR